MIFFWISNISWADKEDDKSYRTSSVYNLSLPLNNRRILNNTGELAIFIA